MKFLSDDALRKLRTPEPDELYAERFAIEREAGSGGTGTVYRAIDRQSGQAVALKILGTEVDSARVAAEVAALQRVDDPAVVRYVAHGRARDGEAWVAMEWLDGETLARRLRRSSAPLPIDETVALGRALASALASVHAQGVVHRDVKPNNVFLVGGQAGAAVKLVDFGLARVRSGALGPTRAGEILGTPGYVAPEQIRGAADVDARADLFSLGCVLFRCLAGTGPFDGNDTISIVGKLLAGDPPRLADLRPDAPAELDALIGSLLARDRDARPSSARRVAEALARVSPAPAPGAPAPVGSAASRAPGRRGRAVVLVAPGDVADAATQFAGAAEPGAGALEAAVARCHGTLVDLGGGVSLVTFDGTTTADLSTRAARCALEIHGAVPAGRAAIGVAGADDAPASLDLAIDRAARLLAHARPGEVRADSLFADSLLPDDVGVRREGDHTLLTPSERRAAADKARAGAVPAGEVAAPARPARRDPLGWSGTVLDGRVAVEAVVGEGGFGVVYRGRHLGFDEPVAVKCLKIPTHLDEAEHEAFVREFRKEARLLHRLSRKTASIVQALDVGAAVSPSGVWTPYIVMEWLEGHTLEHDLGARAARGFAGRGAAGAFALLGPVAEALAVAHGNGIAHLDVKPANLFLVAEDGGVTVKVVDFGIARALTSSDTLTRATAGRGAPLSAFTPQYAAPEQFNARHGRPAQRTDVFALALVFIEVASGRPAFEGDSPLAFYVAAANEEVRPSLSARGVSAEPAVEAVVRRALAPKPDDRYADAGAFWEALGRALAGAPGATRASVPSPGPSAAEPNVEPAERAAPTEGQNRVCTVLVAELAGAPALGRHVDPERLAQIVEDGRAVLRSAVEASGGEIQDLVGDRVVAVFGLRSETVGAAARAVHAALRMRADLAERAHAPRATRLKLRAGVDTGRVFVRWSATSTGRHEAITGAPVSVASRLAQRAEPDAVLLGRDVHRQVAGLFDVEALDLPRDGDEPPGRAFRVIDVAASGTAAGGILVEREFFGRPTRFVGRAVEMEALASLADDSARRERARTAVVFGAPGVGKSRLVVEAAAALERDGFVVFTAQASPLSTGQSYALAATLLRARFRLHHDDPPELVVDKLRRGIAALRVAPSRRPGRTTTPRRPVRESADPSEVAELLARALGHGRPRASGDLGGADESGPIKRRIAAAFSALIGSSSAPVAILCDDVHLADDASLELLDDLAIRLGDRALVIVCAGPAALGDRRPAWKAGDSAREVLSLRTLSAAQLEDIAADRLQRVAELPAELLGRLADRADGYPLVLTETLHLLVDGGAIVTTDPERWTFDSTRAAALWELPATIQSIVQARLDALEPGLQRLVARAAVIGRALWDGALASLETPSGQEPAARAALVGSLDELCARGVMRKSPTSTFPDEQEYVFAEQAILEVAYGTLGQAARRELHGRVATWLQARAFADGDAAPLAHHYEKALRLEAARAAWMRAASHAAELGENAAAAESYERALRIDRWMGGDADAADELAGWEGDATSVAPWQERVRLRADLGDVLRRMGRLEAAEQRYEEARALIQGRLADPVAVDASSRDAARWQARVDFRLSLVVEIRGDVPRARELVVRAIDSAERAGLVEERAEMHAHLAALFLRDRAEGDAARACRAGLAVLRSALRRGQRWREAAAWLLRTLGGAFFHERRLVRAERCYQQAARLLDERTNPYGVARVANNIAATRFLRGDLASARDAFVRTLALSQRSGDLWMTMTALGNLGEVEHALGHDDAAHEYLEDAVQLGERIGARAEVAECWRNLAVVRSARSDPKGALDAAGRALAHVASGGCDVYLAPVAATVAELCAREAQGEHAATARALARDLAALLEAPEHHAVREACRASVEPLL